MRLTTFMVVGRAILPAAAFQAALRTSLILIASVASSAPPPKLPEPYQSIVDQAHSTPPEFAAEALLRVVESNKITDRDARVALIEEAFHLASAAQLRMSLHVSSGYNPDSRAGYLDRAYRLKLDGLSLQSRAVRDLVSLDKPKARELFSEIPRPALQPLNCDDALAPDVADFYDALALVVGNTFTEKERAKEEHLNFLLSYLAEAASPVQLARLARLIHSLNVTPDQRDVVIGRFNAILESLQPDDRSFSATVDELSKELTPQMSASFEKYLHRGQTGARCKDNSQAKVEAYWQSDQAVRLYQAAQQLRISPEGSLISVATRTTTEWNRKLTDFLKDFADWTASQEKSEADYYHQKCIVYEALLDLTPAGDQHQKLLSEFVNFMSGSNLQQQNPVEWFLHAGFLYDRVKNTSYEDAGKVLEVYRSSGNPMLVLFSMLERNFASKIPSWAAAATNSN